MPPLSAAARWFELEPEQLIPYSCDSGVVEKPVQPAGTGEPRVTSSIGFFKLLRINNDEPLVFHDSYHFVERMRCHDGVIPDRDQIPEAGKIDRKCLPP